MKALDLEIGKRYGSLIVLRKTKKIGGRLERALWEFQCDCGNIYFNNATIISSGHTKSCGCWKKNGVVDPITNRWIPSNKIHVAALRLFSSNYQYRDKKKGYDTCSFQEFLKLSQLPCHYCGTKELTCYFKHKSKEEVFRYNTLDRKDSSQGHVLNNIVTCCKQCNYAKSDIPYDDFLMWIKKVNHNLFG